MKMPTWKVFAYFCIVLYTVSKNVVHADVCDSPGDTYAISQILLKVYKGNSSYNTFTSSLVSNAEILEKEIDPAKDTVFYTHGFTHDANTDVVKVVINAYLDRGDVNLIVGDWGNIAKYHEYVYVSSNVAGVGEAYAQAINKLANVINFSTFHVAGHSLGAHIGGFIGRSLNRTLNRLTGLDPAYPLFYPSHCHISPTDADFVVILHTDKGVFGTPYDTGSVDFSANNGTSPQPFAGKIDTVKCCNCNGNHPASYKGCEIRKQLQKKLFPPLRRRTYSQQNIQLKTTEANPIHNAYHTPNTKDKNIKLTDHRSYAQVTTNTVLLNEPDQNNNNDTTEIKELLKQSIKNSEILTKMIMEQNAILRQQTQQITTMLQLLTNTLTHK